MTEVEEIRARWEEISGESYPYEITKTAIKDIRRLLAEIDNLIIAGTLAMKRAEEAETKKENK